MDETEEQIQAVKEEDTTIEELEMVNKPIAYPVDLILVPLPEKLIVWLEKKPIAAVSS